MRGISKRKRKEVNLSASKPTLVSQSVTGPPFGLRLADYDDDDDDEVVVVAASVLVRVSCGHTINQTGGQTDRQTDGQAVNPPYLDVIWPKGPICVVAFRPSAT